MTFFLFFFVVMLDSLHLNLNFPRTLPIGKRFWISSLENFYVWKTSIKSNKPIQTRCASSLSLVTSRVRKERRHTSTECPHVGASIIKMEQSRVVKSYWYKQFLKNIRNNFRELCFIKEKFGNVFAIRFFTWILLRTRVPTAHICPELWYHHLG